MARLGGDEFGILLTCCSLQRAERISAQLLKAINDYRFCWLGKSFAIGGSIGLVPIDRNSASVSELLGRADIACYAAKDLGRNRIHVYQDDDSELTRRHGEMQWVTRIHWALEHNRLTLYRQNIHDLSDTSRPWACEVLLRFTDEGGHQVRPGVFLPAAERYNLAPAVDRWVVGHLLQFLARQHRPAAGLPNTFFINLSGATLNDEGFDVHLRALLRDTGLPPSLLCFEITETAAIANLSRAIDFIEAIRAEGCRFALDDFGTGLSSFAYLKTLPVDFLKIDGDFVRDITRDPMDRAIVEAINRIGHTVGLKTVAEFVEDEATTAALVELGVDYAQGYAFHQPEPLMR